MSEPRVLEATLDALEAEIARLAAEGAPLEQLVESYERAQALVDSATREFESLEKRAIAQVDAPPS